MAMAEMSALILAFFFVSERCAPVVKDVPRADVPLQVKGNVGKQDQAVSRVHVD